MPCVIALHGIWPQPFQPFRWCGLNLPWLQMVHILTQRDVKGTYGWTWEWDFFTNTNNGNGEIWNFHRIVPLYIYIFVFCHILSYSMYSRAQGGLYHSVDGQNPAVGNGWSPWSPVHQPDRTNLGDSRLPTVQMWRRSFWSLWFIRPYGRNM